MERQAGLGRSLREVIDSLTPVEPETAERGQFDASELLTRLDELLVDVHDLRDQVHQLAKTSKKKRKKAKKKKSKARHD